MRASCRQCDEVKAVEKDDAYNWSACAGKVIEIPTGGPADVAALRVKHGALRSISHCPWHQLHAPLHGTAPTSSGWLKWRSTAQSGARTTRCFFSGPGVLSAGWLEG
jgi:hypothetical protein